jgi:hypothetical protein
MGESSALQSILYDRGALRLLDQVPPSASPCAFSRVEVVSSSSVPDWGLDFLFDVMQRKLPLEEVYIDVKGSADGW